MFVSRLKAHEGAINAIATLPDSQLFATGGSDLTVKLWNLPLGNEQAAHVYTICLKPRYIPLSIAIGESMFQDGATSVFIVVGGTRNFIQVYAVSDVTAVGCTHTLQATMTGHESWITSLALRGGRDPNDDLWLASASQDKSVRLWRISQIKDDRHNNRCRDDFPSGESLSAKVHTIKAGSVSLSIVFEALLLAHDDWVYTASWSPRTGSQQLLTASADNSMIIWEREPSSGIWVSSSRLGEISGQKGATSATGSTGGFWVGLWSHDANAVACLGKTGGWRLWRHDRERSYWIQNPGLTGHTKTVTDLSWTSGGEYLLSTSSDQTTRLHAKWQWGTSASWHEFARPQIHGYDLNCVHSLSPRQFVSGADEKLLRVFDQPRNVAQMLERLCLIGSSDGTEDRPEAADMPVLGLSNKAITQNAGDNFDGGGENDAADGSGVAADKSEGPPTEDYLARHTLWPEREKLYGHGHEISALAGNRSGSIIATACKASSPEHAVIRLYETRHWQEIRPPLAAHSLTIARLRFHMNNDQLLSAGRDRQWALFTPAEVESVADVDKHVWRNYSLLAANPKGHSRMILDVAWSTTGAVALFATASRDKTIKIWASVDERGDEFSCRTTITRQAPVSAIDLRASDEGDMLCLAAGEETGRLSYHILSVRSFGHGDSGPIAPLQTHEVMERLCPSKAVTRLAWRPAGLDRERVRAPNELAVASADSSIRILMINWQGQQGEGEE